jgi:hypothetical protein
VFLDDSEPADPPPAPLDLLGGVGFPSVSPGIAQGFFIGDGLTGTGEGDLQEFHVPVGATRLFLGLFDYLGCMEPPGGYADNSGEFQAALAIEVLCPADLNGDGFVNVSDFLHLLAEWGECPGCPEDIDGDGVVNVIDFLLLLAHWGPCP